MNYPTLLRIRLSILFLLSIATTNVFAQRNELLTHEKGLLAQEQNWYEGTIVLSDGSELTGLVRFNDRESFVAFNDGDNKRVFTQASVVWFSFFDHFKNVNRTFLSLPFPNASAKNNPKYIFEVIREYKTFAVLLRKDPVTLKQKLVDDNIWAADPFGNQSMPHIRETTTRMEVSQVETIYFLNGEGEIMPYLELRNKEDGSKSLFTGEDRKTRKKMFDADLLATFITDPIYDKLKKFASENGLKFNRKEDFINILSYYDTLID